MKLVLALILLFHLNKAFSQAYNDSIAITKAKAAYKLSPQKPDSALSIAESLIIQSQKSDDKRLAAFAYKARGWAFARKGFFEKSFPDLFKAASLFQQLHEEGEELRMYINISLTYSNKSEFVRSAIYLVRADSMAQRINDQKAMAEVKRLMGILYRQQEQYQQAIPYFKASMAMYLSLKDTISFFGAAASLSIAYVSSNHPDSSLLLLRSCIPLIYAMPGKNYERSVLNERLGDAYYASSRYSEALESYKKAYEVFAGDNSQSDMAYEKINIGKTLIKLQKYKEAEAALLSSYELNDRLKMENYLPDAAQQLAILYQATGDWQKACNWLKKEYALTDSLQLKSQNEKTAQLQAQFEAVKKENEISLLKKDQELNYATLQRQRANQRWYIMLFILIFVAGVLGIGRYRATQKTKRLLEIEKIRNTIARDLHDDIGSALSSINIISKLAIQDDSGEPKANKHLRKIHENSSFIMENMHDIVWAINPMNDDLERIFYKMREFATDILEPLNIGYNLTVRGNFGSKKLTLDKRKEIYLIFKEAINNAAKYSGCSKIDTIIASTDEGIEIRIEDNGVGFDRGQIKAGNGLRNMEERAKRIHSAIGISSNKGKGTVITLIIKSHD
ncbi:MAG: histidine kinase [Bacteroidota bacterium]|nr:histidine kinase [Bacteroidota bacterium]